MSLKSGFGGSRNRFFVDSVVFVLPRKVKRPLTPKDERPRNTKHKQTVTEKVTMESLTDI
jgi:hypothetical protein